MKKYTLSISSSSLTWKTTQSGSNTRLRTTSGLSTYYVCYSSGFTMNKSTTNSNLSLYRAQ